MESIHGRIRRLRGEAGLSQKELAKACGVKYQTVQQWEREVRGTAPTRTRQPLVAKALDVTVQELMSGAPEGSQKAPAGVPKRVAKLWDWLTDEEKERFIDEMDERATHNRIVAQQFGGAPRKERVKP